MILEQFKLSNKVVCVTGGNRGLGQAMAIGLAQAGATLFLASDASRYVHGQVIVVNGG